MGSKGHKAARGHIVVAGYVVRFPLGGMTWHPFHYVLGLRRLGYKVTFIEDNGSWPDACYDPARGVMGDDPSYGLRYLRALFREYGMEEDWVFVDARGGYHGKTEAQTRRVLAGADLLLNISGVNWRPEFLRCPERVYIDTDPGFTQIGLLSAEESGAGDWRHVRDHAKHFTFGQNMGGSDCTVPGCGITWIATRQPIVLEEWPAKPAPPGAPLTTVMSWSAYGAKEYRGAVYGQKDVEFARFLDLPDHLPANHPGLEIALSGNGVPYPALLEHGWVLRDAGRVTRTPASYRGYIQNSGGEFSVAKSGYVRTNSGWFSDRSACYLASGRPVAAQDTGWSASLPSGEGLFAVRDSGEAAEALRQIAAEPQRHQRAARALAEENFDSGIVLTRLLNDC